jgi:lysophospholipase L1-like esterase
MEAPAEPELEAGRVLRQVVRISTDVATVRLRLSNEYGAEPLVLGEVRLAIAGTGGTIQPETDRPVRFSGANTVSVPPRSARVSDPLTFSAPAHADLAITVRLLRVPGRLTGHPGSRATSYLTAIAGPSDASLANASPVVHWYFLIAIEAAARGPGRAAVVCLGDSITDGHGCLPDQNTRWTDELSRRVQAVPATARVAILNLGIGGGRLLRPGAGPAGLARLSRDVFDQAGVAWLILQLGVNDLGTRIAARKAGQPYASAEDIIAGYRRILADCRDRGIQVGLATITPFAGAAWYSTPDIEADRQRINRWIRAEAPCDRVIDFDAALRDPSRPTLLLPAFDSGDHLHPSTLGYRRMAESVPLDFFAMDPSGAVRPPPPPS